MKTKLKYFIIAVLIFVFSTNLLVGQNLSAKEVVTKSYNLFLGKSSFSVMKMVIERPSWSRSIQMQAWSLGEDYFLAYITAPARDEGQVSLKYKNEMWNYIPAINRVIKIPPSMMMQSWMGSDFTNNDLMKQNSIIKDYTHSFSGNEKIDNYDCYIVELKPLPDAAVVWGSIKIWIAKDNLNALKSEFFDTNGKVIKTETASDLKMMGGRLLASHLEMKSNIDDGHKTIIKVLHQEFNVNGIDLNFFSIQNMKNIRPLKY